MPSKLLAETPLETLVEILVIKLVS